MAQNPDTVDAPIEDEVPAPEPSLEAPDPEAPPTPRDTEAPAPQDPDAPVEDPVPFQLPALHLVLPPGVNVDVTTDEEGLRHVLIGPLVLLLEMVFNDESGKFVASKLAGGVELATILSPQDKALAEQSLQVRK